MLTTNSHYSVVEILNISKCLSSQIDDTKECKNSVYKAILEQKDTKFIVYFLDGVSFGPESVIEVLSCKNAPILYKDDYKIVKHAPFSVNQNFIQKLIAINKQKQPK